MKSFFKYMFATVVGIIVSTILLILIGGGIIAGIITTATSEKMTTVKNNTVLHIKFKNPIPERTSKNPFENFDPMNMDAKQSIGLNDILKNLEKASKDKNVKGIFLNVSFVPVGVASLQEIRGALEDFKDSSKFIIAYSDVYTQGAYYLASVADKVYLNPEGMIEFKGLNAEIMFFKRALEKLGVEPQIIRGKNNKFKSAVEPFMYEKMSDANRGQTIKYLGSIWNNLLTEISKSRKISVDDLNKYADSLTINNAEAAKKYNFVDDLKYMDEIIAELKELSGTKENKKLQLMKLAKYDKAPGNKNGKFTKDKIAIVYATGQIESGKGDMQTIGSEGLSQAIREARLDSNIKAIVLRVNSPGGSALASEVIWREVVLAKKEKPVIVSMGDVAASGGYYIACPADLVVANSNTITGSIGVFGVLWNGQKLLNDKLGISFDRVKTNYHSDLGSMYRPLTASEKAIIQNNVEEVYDVFLTHVSEGRDMTKNEVDSIGQGRVWSGTNAKEIGLIDEFGGLKKCVEIASEKAKLENFRIVELPKQEEPFEKFMKEFIGEAKTSFVKEELGQTYNYYKKLQKALDFKGIQARLPYEVDIY